MAKVEDAERSRVANDAGRTLCDRYWKELLRLDPLLATAVGEQHYDDVLPDPSEQGIANRRLAHDAFLRVIGAIDRSALDPVVRGALDIAEANAIGELNAIRWRLDRLHHVDHMNGPLSLPGRLAEITNADTRERIDRYIARLTAIGSYVDAVIAEMQLSARSGDLYAPEVIAARVLEQTDRLLATPTGKWPLVMPVPSNHQRGRARVQAVADEVVAPAYRRYRDAVRAYRSQARSTLALGGLPDGRAMYAGRIRRWTDRDIEPEELHERGREELHRIADDRARISADLHVSDAASAVGAEVKRQRQAFGNPRALLAHVKEYVNRGWEDTASYFGRRPGTNCEVHLVDKVREADYPGAYYEPAGEGRAGRYFVNAGFYLDPASQLLHRLATTTYHEANPGHHFQISLEQELGDAPAIRRFVATFRSNAFTEGWGLYAEGLAEELGLFQDPFERLGRLDNDALRAVRLVVDTGIHALGWDRDRAIGEMAAVGIPRAEAEIEVDRYAMDPAQALCYKVGQLEIDRLRRRFAPDGTPPAVMAFHDRLLAIGTLPTPALERELELAYGGPRQAAGRDG